MPVYNMHLVYVHSFHGVKQKFAAATPELQSFTNLRGRSGRWLKMGSSYSIQRIFTLEMKKKKLRKNAFSKVRIFTEHDTFFLTSLSVGLSLKNFVFTLLFGGIN